MYTFLVKRINYGDEIKVTGGYLSVVNGALLVYIIKDSIHRLVSVFPDRSWEYVTYSEEGS
jgi:hypothetical protein